ncbi:MAG: ATPase domain-containing protein [Sulfolobales archaeon]
MLSVKVYSTPERVEEKKEKEKGFDIERIKIDIPMLSEDLEGGIPKRELILLTGPPGAGKTITAIKILSDAISQGMRACYISSEMTSYHVRMQARKLGIDLPKFQDFRPEEGEKLSISQPIFVDAYSFSQLSDMIRSEMSEKGKESKYVSPLSPATLYRMFNELLSAVGESAASEGKDRVEMLIVFDSTSPFIARAPSLARNMGVTLLSILRIYSRPSKKDKESRAAVYTTVVATAQVSSTTGITYGFPLEHIASGIIAFEVIVPKKRGDVIERIAYVKKMRYTKHYMGTYDVLIDYEANGRRYPIYFKR